MADPVCAIIGVGPGNGAAFAKRFAREGYALALMARNEAYLNGLASEMGNARAYAYDASDPSVAGPVFERIKQDLGPVDVLLYNAGSGHFGNIDKITAEDLETNWRVNTLGLFAAVQAVLPQMREQGQGNIVVTGATASVKHSANFSAFTSAKASQRALAQSLARHLGPENIHVSHVIVDGVIDIERTRKMMPDQPDDFFLKPEAIADAVWFLTRQPKSARSFELDLRPYGEKW